MSVGEFIFKLLPRPVVDRINAIPFARRIARGAFWVLLGAAAVRVLRVPISIILARYMGPTQYGELGIISGSIDLFGVFAGFGLGLTATKYIAEFRTRDPIRAGRILSVSSVVAAVGGAVFAIILYLVAPYLAAHTLSAPHLSVPLRIGALALFFSSMNGAQMGALYGFEAFQVTAKLQAILGLVDLPFMLGGYYLGGLNGVICGMVCSRFVSWMFSGFALREQARRHNIHIVLGHWRHELGILWHFSVPAALAGIMVMPVNWICSTLLVNQPNGYAEMGIYSAANQWYGTMLFIPTLLGNSLLPLLSDRMGERDGQSSGSILKTMMKLNGLIVVPFAVGLSLFSPWVMRMYGVGYGQAWLTLIAAVWTAAIMGIITPVGDVIAASGRMWLGLLTNAGWAAVFLVTTLFLVHLGSLGLASSRLIAYIVHAIWTIVIAQVILQSQQDKNPPIHAEGISVEPEPITTDVRQA
jgi:O-antigen/teichoic acid export membrane protein